MKILSCPQEADNSSKTERKLSVDVRVPPGVYETEIAYNRGRQSSPDPNPLYAECSFENYSAAADSHSVVDVVKRENENEYEMPRLVETATSMSVVTVAVAAVSGDERVFDVAQKRDENSVVDRISQITVANNMANECSHLVEQATMVVEEKSLSKTSDIFIRPVTVQVPAAEKEVVESDNSEAYLTPTEVHDSDRKSADSEILKSVSHERVESECLSSSSSRRPVSPFERRESEGTIAYCNGHVDDKEDMFSAGSHDDGSCEKPRYEMNETGNERLGTRSCEEPTIEARSVEEVEKLPENSENSMESSSSHISPSRNSTVKRDDRNFEEEPMKDSLSSSSSPVIAAEIEHGRDECENIELSESGVVEDQAEPFRNDGNTDRG